MTIKPNLDINQGKLHLHSSFGVHYVIKRWGPAFEREQGGTWEELERRKEREK